MFCKMTRILLATIVVFGVIAEISAQKQYKSKRWRLRFELEKDRDGLPIPPKPVVITDPDGSKNTYWYFRYKIFNDTGRDIPYRVNIKLVIDKSREGVPESKVPELFYKARIPEGQDKKEYIRSLRTYHDIDLPLVKREILSRLSIYPRLSEEAKKVLASLTLDTPKSVANIALEVGLSPAETEAVLNHLVVRNLALSQEIEGNPIFIKGTIQTAIFVVNEEKVEKKAGDEIAGWRVVSFDRDSVVVEKDGFATRLGIGSTLEYLYVKSGKTPVEMHPYYSGGMTAKGDYKGRKGEEKQQYEFERRVIGKGDVIHGLALFAGVSPEVDFMAVVVSGLIDPIVRRYKVVYAHNEVLMLGYEILGDEFSILRQELTPLYKKWEVLSSKVVRRYEGR